VQYFDMKAMFVTAGVSAKIQTAASQRLTFQQGSWLPAQHAPCQILACKHRFVRGRLQLRSVEVLQNT
jgi:hypothetical protein